MKKSKFHSLLLRVAQGAALMSLTTLTLADDLLQIFTLAATNDAGIQQARARYGANHTLLDQQRAQLLPALAVNASSSRDTTGVDGTPAGGGVFAVTPHSFANGFNTKGYGVNLNQNLLNFQAWYQYKSARSGDDAAMATLIQSEQELIMRVASAYLDALRGQANLVSFEAEDEASQAVLAQTRQRYNAGLIPLTDVYDSQANADLASVNLLVARNDLKRRLKALEVITGQQHGPLETLSAEFPIAPATMSLQEWTETAVANNPQLQAAASELAASEDTARAARAALLPTLALNMGYNWNQSGNPFSFSQLPVERSNISVSFSMPVFAGGLNRSRMRQAYYTRDATESALLKARRDNDEAISNS
ncbi:MAG: TolC family protein, partial [Pseudomonadota bacterium]